MNIDKIKEWVPQLEKMSIEELDTLHEGIIHFTQQKIMNMDRLRTIFSEGVQDIRELSKYYEL
jgi:hypothetical protein